MTDSLGFYLISDFHIDLNYLIDPKNVEGSILHSYESKRARVVKQIYDWSSIPKKSIIAFVGDSANSAEVAAMVWKEAAEQDMVVLAIPGNHEYYYPRFRTVGETDAKMREEIALIPAIHLLEPFGNQTFAAQGTLFLGCTGWYNWDACPEYDRGTEREFWKAFSNDSRAIQYDYGYPDAMARRHADWLIEQVTAAQDNDEVERIVVLTHTAPKAQLLVPAGHEWYRLNGSYSNSFMEEVPFVDVKKKIKVWGYGHTHFRDDIVIDGVRYVNNARGYAGEQHNARQTGGVWMPKWIDLTEPDSPYTEEIPS